MSNPLQMTLFSDIVDHHSKGWFSGALATLGVNEQKSSWPDAFGNALRSWSQQRVGSKITAISLFSGGGLDIGFHDAGLDLIECNEIEPAFAATLQKNAVAGGRLAGAKIICQDIHDYSPSVK